MLDADQFAIPGPALDALPVRRHRWPGRLWLRAKLAFRAPALDRDLATGGRPDRDELHALRTLQLVSTTYRRHVAEGLEKAVRRDARTVIADEREALLDLAARLLSPRPVSAQGVAITVLLLSQPDSPLHDEPVRHDAVAELARAALYRL
jgi:hypothetical protein